MAKNKLRTPSYFIKRLRENGFIVLKLFSVYGKHDARRWSVIINPSGESILCTCYANKNELGETLFEFDDGGVKIPKNFYIKTDSAEVIIKFLFDNGIFNQDYPGRDRYLRKGINNIVHEEAGAQ